MFYIIQENLFKERHYDMLISYLDQYDLPYELVRIFPFIDKIVALKDIPTDSYNIDDLPEFIPPTNNVWVFGAIKLARIAADRGWSPGSFMNANHDFEVYSKYYKDNLLNYDSKIYKIGDQLEWNDGEIKFIRPTRDTKSFTGSTFTQGEWEERVTHNLHNFRNDNFSEDTLIQVSTPKTIYNEIRCWVVCGKVVTASTYRVGGAVMYNRAMVDNSALEFAQSMVDIFQVADSFAIDICLTPNGWKIVECGNINCTGFYDADLSKLLKSIDDNYNKI
jgi:hypothetical protein